MTPPRMAVPGRRDPQDGADRPGAPDGPGALDGVVPVSRETVARLAVFVDMLRRWQPAQNLVGRGTLGRVWQRHIADSAQLAGLFPDTAVWADLGSGAGFPGLVLAILMLERNAGEVLLIESNRRKCAFLRQVVRETGARAVVCEGRIEDVLRDVGRTVDRVAARALAPLDDLLHLGAPLFRSGAGAAFHKGQDFVAEVDEASKSWEFDLVQHRNRVGGDGVILDLTNIRPRLEHG